MPKRVYKKNEEDSKEENMVKYDFLVTTANMAYFDQKEKHLVISLILETVMCLQKLGYSWACRIFDNDILNAIKSVAPSVYNDTGYGFEVTSKKYECLLTSPSSIAIPFFMDDKPVGFFDYRDGPIFLQSGWRISIGSRISESLTHMLYGESEERIIFQKAQLCFSQEHMVVGEELKKNVIRSLEKYNNAKTLTLSERTSSRCPSWSFEYLSRSLYKFLKENKYTKKIVSDKIKPLFVIGKR